MTLGAETGAQTNRIIFTRIMNESTKPRRDRQVNPRRQPLFRLTSLSRQFNYQFIYDRDDLAGHPIKKQLFRAIFLCLFSDFSRKRVAEGDARFFALAKIAFPCLKGYCKKVRGRFK